jgi:8-oxo-dGTP pyrophosphatase MutT (NUDIX family)
MSVNLSKLNFMLTEFYQYLKNRLQKTLPGRSAQMEMAPKPVDKNSPTRETQAPEKAHPGSVLLLLFPDAGQNLKFILTLRTRHINHGGQISLPGGRAENNENAVETALREAKEEIGVHRNAIRIAGELSNLYVSVSNNNVTPVVGFTDSPPELTINSREVEEAFFINPDLLLDEDNLIVEEWKLHGEDYRIPYWKVHRVPLWGATAMMLSEFVELYREFVE